MVRATAKSALTAPSKGMTARFTSEPTGASLPSRRLVSGFVVPNPPRLKTPRVDERETKKPARRLGLLRVRARSSIARKLAGFGEARDPRAHVAVKAGAIPATGGGVADLDAHVC